MKKNRLFLVLTLILTLFFLTNYNFNIKKFNHTPHATLSDITYKAVSNKNIKLDFYKPTIQQNQKSPAIIYFHGGSWISGNKSKILQRYRKTALQHLLDAGYTVFSADYRLVNFSGNHIDQAVEDCKDAVNHVIKNAFFYNIDTAQIGLWGSSAGAHLAMLAAMAPDSCLGKCHSNANIIGKIKFIIDDFGPSNISEMFKTVNPTLRKKISDVFFDIPTADLKTFDSLTTAFSPSVYAKENKIPTLIFHGLNDKIVPTSQSENLYLQLNKTNSCIYLFDNLGHGFNGMDSSKANLYSQACLNFLDNINVKN